MCTFKNFGSNIKNEIISIIAAKGGTITNIELLDILKQQPRYKSIQLNIVDSKLNKLCNAGAIKYMNTDVVTNYNLNKIDSTVNQASYTILDGAYVK
jgi:hypothetical protein